MELLGGWEIFAAFILIMLVGIRNPPRKVCAEDCAGGQFAGQPVEAGRAPARTPAPAVPEPAAVCGGGGGRR